MILLLAFPVIEKAILEHGPVVYSVRTPSPVVYIGVEVDGGSVRSRWAFPAFSLLEEVFDGLDSLDNLGGELWGEVRREGVFYVISIRKERVKEGIYLLKEFLLTRPHGLPEGFYERMKVKIKKLSSSPATHGKDVLFKHLYRGPYSKPLYLLPDSISLDSINAYLEKHVGIRNITLAIAGNVNPDSLLPYIDSLFSDFPEGDSLPPLPLPSPVYKKRVVLIKKKGWEQVWVWQGRHLGVKMDDKLYFPMVLLNACLGGSGTLSRLYSVVREEHGWAYAIHTYFYSRSFPGPWVMKFETKKENLKDVISTVNEIIENPLDGADMERVKDYLMGNFFISLSSPYASIRFIFSCSRWEVDPYSFILSWEEKLEKPELQDVGMAEGYLLSSPPVWVVMGDLTEEEVKEIFGDVEVIEE